MNPINTTLTTSGNSVAVRLPKELLRLSGLGRRVTLTVKDGQIIIGKAHNARQGWDAQITKLKAEHGDPTGEFSDMTAASHDGFDDLPWDGPTDAKIS